MDFRRPSLSEDRRRRLLNDGIGAENTASTPASPAKTSGASPTRSAPRYTPAADMDQQPRIVDLIPRRKLTMWALFLGGLLVIGGLEWLYSLMPQLSKSTTDGRVAALDLDGEGSLAAWFSSVTLSLAGLAAWLVYTLRRHRLDDYKARYRVWMWAALAWFVMGIDESSSLHEGFKELMAHVTGNRIFGDGSLWWVIAYGAVLGVVGLRLLLDMRECWASTALLISAAASYVVAVIVQLQLLMPQRGAHGVMVEEGCEMAGNLLLLTAMTVHARYIIRDIEGLIDHSGQEERRRKKAERAAEKAAQRKSLAAEKETAREAARVEKEKVRETARKEKEEQRKKKEQQREKKKAAQPVTAGKKAEPSKKQQAVAKNAQPSPQKQQRADGGQSETPPPKKLTKAEKRALRKQQRKERQGAKGNG